MGKSMTIKIAKTGVPQDLLDADGFDNYRHPL